MFWLFGSTQSSCCAEGSSAALREVRTTNGASLRVLQTNHILTMMLLLLLVQPCSTCPQEMMCRLRLCWLSRSCKLPMFLVQ